MRSSRPHRGVFELTGTRPGIGEGTDCIWRGPGRQWLVVEFLLFPHPDVEDGEQVMVDRETSERKHQDGYTSRPDLADRLGGTGVYLRHWGDTYHTLLVYAEDRAAWFTAMGPVVLSDAQLETLALALDN